MSKHVAVILSGCGVFDGAEINEVVLTLLHLEKTGASYQCYAPDIEQHHVVNHITGEDIEQSRNVLVESARIVRGNIKPLRALSDDVTECDALILPGGFGVAKNLCDFAIKGTDMSVPEEVVNACQLFVKHNKPSGYMCIAPALAPHIFGRGVQVTIGNDADTASALEAMGATHVECAVGEIVVDQDHKLVTTPAYMLAQRISEAEQGIAKLVKAVLELA